MKLITIFLLFTVACFGQSEKHQRVYSDKVSDLRLGSEDVYRDTTSKTVIPDMVDTIYVPVLCEIHTWLNYTAPDEQYSPDIRSVDMVKLDSRRQERVLEWRQRGKSYYLSDMFSMVYWTLESQWIVKSSRWIDSVEGCYQIVPLKSSNQ